MLRSTHSSPAMMMKQSNNKSNINFKLSTSLNEENQQLVPSIPFKSPIKAYLRVRPSTIMEQRTSASVYALLNDYTVRFKPTNEIYEFDRVFPPKTHQETVYRDSLNPLLKPLLLAENSYYFAYGASGQGKSYSLEGASDFNKMKKLAGTTMKKKYSSIKH